MATLSLCMIVQNEETTIVNCLESIKDIVNEIIIVDMGSTDQTKIAVRSFTNQIFEFNGNDHISARNFSFSKASKDYILWLDANDVLLADDRKKLLHLKQVLDKTVDAVSMIYNFSFDKLGNVSLSFRQNRLVKRSKNFQWYGTVHEHLDINGTIIDSDIVITNNQMKIPSQENDFLIENQAINKQTITTPLDFYSLANKHLKQGQLEVAAEHFIRFLAYKKGWVENQISACDKLAEIYYQLRDSEKELHFIVRSFQYDTPRAELCCRLGYYFSRNNEYKKATFWYELATKLEKPKDHNGFYNEAYWTWIPQIQLCVCYYYLGDYEKAYEHNEIARSYQPLDKHALHNKELLEGILKKFKPGYNSIPYNEERPLRIVQIAPDLYTLPPNYGGIEKVVYDLSEELAKRGHEVFVYAPKGSQTSGTLIPYEHRGYSEQGIISHVLRTLPDNIDIIHDHTHYSILAKKNLSIPTIATIHIPIQNNVKYPMYVSKKLLELYGGGNGSVVYNGIDPAEYEWNEHKEDYLLFLGRLVKEKGIHHAIEVAEKTNHKLIIAGPIQYYEYFSQELEPKIRNNPRIEYVGEVVGQQKQNLLKHAKCVLFPSTWDEPFGLVMLEAMACGTPVLAFRNGAVPEVLNGFPECMCQSVEEMAEKVLLQSFPTSQELRGYVRNQFSVAKMADDYLEVYKKLIREQI